MQTFKRVARWIGGILTFLLLVLAIHIYIVTKPKPPGENTVVMARIDVSPQMKESNAHDYASWLYKQPGVQHVMCNTNNSNVVFTYYPIKNDADRITDNFASHFQINAQRFKPSKEQMMAGCPVGNAGSGFYGFIASLFK